MKIQINSLDALERLIGGDTDVEIEIRQSVVEIFSKKYLKSIVSEPLMKATKESLLKEVQDTLMDKEKIDWGYPNHRFVIKEAIVSQVRGTIRKIVMEELGAIIREEIGTNGYKESLDKMVKEQVDYIVNMGTSQEIQAQIQHAAAELIKRKLMS